MFTGIVQGTGKILIHETRPGGLRLRIQLEQLGQNLNLGASVSVAGVCLTVVQLEPEYWAEFDVIQESLDRTTLGSLQVGELVNLERAARIGDEVGGHHVTGHIDTTGAVSLLEESPGNLKLWVQVEPVWTRYLVPKGWIAINGASLTVVDVQDDRFSVCLIPETLARTTLGTVHLGSPLHLEFDHQTKVIVQTLERLLPGLLQRTSAFTTNG